MDSTGMKENGMVRTRSFRDEDYINRRMFLRSYPLDWELGGNHDDHENTNKDQAAGGGSKDDRDHDGLKTKKECSSSSKRSERKRMAMRKIVLSVVHWGGEKVLVLRRLKHKLTIYVFSCIPIGFKPPTALIST